MKSKDSEQASNTEIIWYKSWW